MHVINSRRVFNARFNALDFSVSLLLTHLDALDKVVSLENSSDGVGLHHVLVPEFALGQRLASDYITHVDGAVTAEFGVIVEEDVLGVVISLVNNQRLATAAVEFGVGPTLVVVLNADGPVLLHDIHELAVYVHVVTEKFSFVILS